ncbi:MAG: 3-oxoacyl-[acyl-carrier-protein] reductase [Chloroflexota bacterium]
MSLTDKVAIVTGGSRGIGRAVAVGLGRAGASVVVNYLGNEQAAQGVVAAIGEAGGRAIAVQADVAQAADVERLLGRTLEAFGRIDILVNNAGITRDNLVLRMSERDWDEVIGADLKGPFLCTKAVLRPMVRQRSGRIVFVSSVVGLAGNAGQANYAAAKAGLIGLAKSVAREVASRGITANVVAPGFVETDMTAVLPDSIRQQALSEIPLGRLASPEDVAAAVVFLASDSAGYITGQVLSVNGGMVMS